MSARIELQNMKTDKIGILFGDALAPAAAGAFFLVKEYLRLGRLAFGIVAPLALQITALEKDRGSYARTVHKRIPLNIKNKCCIHADTAYFVCVVL